MDRDELLKHLATFFLDEWGNDAGFVAEYLTLQGADPEEVYNSALEVMEL